MIDPVAFRVQHRRWTAGEDRRVANTFTGLGDHQVRTWTAWRRRTALGILVSAFLPIVPAAEHAPPALPESAPGSPNVRITIYDWRQS